MKSTIQVDDEIYRKFKAKCALKGKYMKDISNEIVKTWVEND